MTAQKFYYRTDDIEESEILESVYNDEFEGLLLVDLDTPPDLKQSFGALNVGTIFARIDVNSDMISETMKNLSKARGYRNFQPQLSMVFKQKGHLCTSSMLKMYHQESVYFLLITFMIICVK